MLNLGVKWFESLVHAAACTCETENKDSGKRVIYAGEQLRISDTCMSISTESLDTERESLCTDAAVSVFSLCCGQHA